MLASVLLYSSIDRKDEATDESLADANTYLPFKIVDTAVTSSIGAEMDALSEEEEEGVFTWVTKLHLLMLKTKSPLSARWSIDKGPVSYVLFFLSQA